MTAPASRNEKLTIEFTVNAEPRTVNVYPMARLLDVLRHDLGLTGTKEGCGEGECGSCSIFVNGTLVNSCLIPAAQANGTEITTIEGLLPESKAQSSHASDRHLHPVQQSFLDCGGAQCGICTPGMILATVALLRKNPQPALNQIREGLAGNLCRCTGYIQIFRAVTDAAQRLEKQSLEQQSLEQQSLAEQRVVPHGTSGQ